MEQKKYTIRDGPFWRITISLALSSFFIFASLYIVQPLLPVFVTEFGVSVSVSSLTLSLHIVGLIIGLIVLGFFSDRHGRTLFIKYSLIGTVIPFFIFPLTDSFFLFVFLRIIQGFCLAGLPAAAIAYIGEEVERRSVGLATALYISSNALGGMIGRVIGGYMTDHYSWEITFYITGIFGLFIMFLVLTLLPKSRYFIASQDDFKKDIEGFFFHLRNKQMILAIGLGIIFQIAFTSIWTYLPFYLGETPFSLSLETISYTYFAYVFGVIGSPIAGWLSGKYRLTTVRNVSVFILAIGIILTVIPSIAMIIIGLCLICFGFFNAHSLTATSISQQAMHHKGSASSLYLVAYYLGVSLGSSAVSPVWNAFNWCGIVLLSFLLLIFYYMLFIIMEKKGEKYNRKIRNDL